MKSFLLALSLLSFSWANGQTMKEAEKMFNVFEYQKAYAIYKPLYGNQSFNIDDLKRFAYASFAIGEFQTCYDVLPNILAEKNSEPYFIYMKAEACMYLKKYGEAKELYTSYRLLDDEFNVQVKIESCDLIPGWNDETFVDLRNGSKNHSKANFSGVNTPFGRVEYHEVGLDSLGAVLSSAHIDQAELVVLRPFFSAPNDELVPLVLDDAYKYSSINAVAIHAQTGTVFLSVAEQTSADVSKRAPHIYTGTWNKEEFSITNLSPWMYGGFADTSACSHVTLNESGTQLAFSKMRDDQSDVFTSYFENDTWSKPLGMENINTGLNEMFPMFMGDTLMSFASDGRPGYGNLDVFTYELSSQNISHLKAPVNGPMDDFNFILESSDSALFVSNRMGGKGDDDIYEIVFKRSPTEIKVVPDSTEYFALMDQWVNQKVYFDFNTFGMKTEVKIAEEFIKVLSKYPSVTVQVESHADKRGGSDYNAALSEKRAQTVVAALITLGVNKNQIVIKSMGENDPVVDCVKCTEEIYAANRVVIVSIKR